MKVIYIVGKYTDESPQKKVEHIIKAQRKGVELAKNGYAIIVPHRNFEGHESILGYEKVMQMCFALIEKCDIVYVLNNFRSSKGSIREISYAEKCKKKIEYESN
jgi:hypothetical protein